MAAGVSAFGSYSGRQPPPIGGNFSSFGDPASFTAGAQTQASDYDTIMKSYGNLASSATNTPITAGTVGPSTATPAQTTGTPGTAAFQSVGYTPTTAQQATYNQSGDVTNSLSNLSDLSATGGYTPQGIADIRARDIAPTRSIYANAQQNVDRSRALGGGYSPNTNATQAQMARDESSQISDINTSANAGIAQNVAANRLAASGQYAGAAASANAAKAQADQNNANIVNQTNQFNTQGQQQASEFNTSGQQAADEYNISQRQAVAEANANRAQSASEANANRAVGTGEFNVNAALQAAQANRGAAQAAITGQANLYGTTPALTKTFGDQVIQAGNLGQGQQQLDAQKQRDIFGMARWGGG